jgi:hypothetical protein
MRRVCLPYLFSKFAEVYINGLTMIQYPRGEVGLNSVLPIPTPNLTVGTRTVEIFREIFYPVVAVLCMLSISHS